MLCFRCLFFAKRRKAMDRDKLLEMIADERTQKVLRHFCFRLTSRIRSWDAFEEAEDLAQAVTERAIRHIKSFEGRATIITWLCRIALNLYLSKLGRKNSDNSLHYDLSLDYQVEEYLTIAETVIDQNQLSETTILFLIQLKKALKELKKLYPKQYEALGLWVLYDLDYEGIAQVQGSKMQAVKSRLNRAREFLRQRTKDL